MTLSGELASVTAGRDKQPSPMSLLTRSALSNEGTIRSEWIIQRVPILLL